MSTRKLKSRLVKKTDNYETLVVIIMVLVSVIGYLVVRYEHLM
jgi:hypothetical protein